LGILEANIIVECPDLKKCYSILSEDKKKVENFLKNKYSIAEKEFEFRPARIGEEYRINERGFATEEFIKFGLRQSIKIESKDVEKNRKAILKLCLYIR